MSTVRATCLDWYTASFCKKGNKIPFNLIIKSESSAWVHALASMSGGHDIEYKGIESFICAMYGSKAEDVNELRPEKFQRLAGKQKNGKFLKINKVNCLMLPPCRNALNKKVERSLLVAKMWAQADTLSPHEGLMNIVLYNTMVLQLCQNH